ncbi:hypothetical protein MPL3365_20020 [Mesorhizobium plurifarium]|uniref:Uncharacterized protein n=1 Tax=Mesorhizobium plurifarium TaxID=69974 RepID=A0A090G823_MESPL|nr:hypothetical protein MPL3365_20020 [Mesorhizobium plurifarium]
MRLPRSESETVIQPEMHGLRLGADQIFQGFLRRRHARREPAIDAVGAKVAVVGFAWLFSEAAADGRGDRKRQRAVRVGMDLGEKAKLQAGLDAVFLGLLARAKSPKNPGIGCDLGEKVHMHVDPVGTVPVVERHPAPTLQLVTAVAEAPGFVAEWGTLMDIDERGRPFLGHCSGGKEEGARQERRRAETCSDVGLLAHARSTSPHHSGQRLDGEGSSGSPFGRIMGRRIARVPLLQGYLSRYEYKNLLELSGKCFCRRPGRSPAESLAVEFWDLAAQAASRTFWMRERIASIIVSRMMVSPCVSRICSTARRMTSASSSARVCQSQPGTSDPHWNSFMALPFLERFTETANRSISLFDTIPNGKPLRTFPGIALTRGGSTLAGRPWRFCPGSPGGKRRRASSGCSAGLP